MTAHNVSIAIVDGHRPPYNLANPWQISQMPLKIVRSDGQNMDPKPSLWTSSEQNDVVRFPVRF